MGFGKGDNPFDRNVEVALPRAAQKTHAAIAEVLVGKAGSIGGLWSARETCRVEIAIQHPLKGRSVRIRRRAGSLRADLASYQAIDRSRVGVEDAERIAGLDHADAGDLPR